VRIAPSTSAINPDETTTLMQVSPCPEVEAKEKGSLSQVDP
jgi:hypothetical protein